MYLSIYKVKGPDTNTALLCIKSNLPSDAPQQIQEYLDAMQDPEYASYDPLFPWESSRVVVLYHGLAEEPEEDKICLPDGREAEMYNINLGCTNRVALALSNYSEAMEQARFVLLAGASPLAAAQALCEYCDQKGFALGLASSVDSFDELVEEMEMYQTVLEADLRTMQIGACAD